MRLKRRGGKMRGNPYLGEITDNRQPQDYIIRKENEPLLSQGYAYHIYLKDGTPLYMAEPTIEKLKERLYKGYPVKSLTIED
jgi:hypothetical protein